MSVNTQRVNNVEKEPRYSCIQRMDLVSCSYHTVCVSSEGEMWSFGNNDFGQLGDSTSLQRSKPEKIECLKNICSVSCGQHHTVAMDTYGNVYSFGLNKNGQLGSSCTTNSPSPQQINFTKDTWITAISCGKYHTLCLDDGGNVWSFGANNNGQLGSGHMKDQLTPQMVDKLPEIISISCGGDMSFFVDDYSRVYCCGQNNFGQLGLGFVSQRVSSPTKISTLSDVKTVAVGASFVCFLVESGLVYSCGDNIYGQLGHGDHKQRKVPEKIEALPIIDKIACGTSHSLFIDLDCCLWSCGNNSHGQLGLGDIIHRRAPVKVLSLKEICSVSSGGNHTIVKETEGSVLTFGYNDYGQLGHWNEDQGKQYKHTPKPLQAALSDIVGYVLSSRAKSARK